MAITKSVGGPRGRKSKASRRAAGRGSIAMRLRYCSQAQKYGAENALEPTFTNCAGRDIDSVIKEMEALSSLRPGVTDPARHIVISLEKQDRVPTRGEWQRMIDIYVQERGLKDAKYCAFVHSDGHGKRNPFHLHIVYSRVLPDGSLVPDKHDMWANRATSRRIESELGFLENPGRDRPWSGSDRRTQKARAQGNVPPEPRARSPIPLPPSDAQDAEIFVKNLMRKMSKASKDAAYAAASEKREEAFAVRSAAAVKRSNEIEERQARTRAAEAAFRAQQGHKPGGEGQGVK